MNHPCSHRNTSWCRRRWLTRTHFGNKLPCNSTSSHVSRMAGNVRDENQARFTIVCPVQLNNHLASTVFKEEEFVSYSNFRSASHGNFGCEEMMNLPFKQVSRGNDCFRGTTYIFFKLMKRGPLWKLQRILRKCWVLELCRSHPESGSCCSCVWNHPAHQFRWVDVKV